MSLMIVCNTKQFQILMGWQHKSEPLDVYCILQGGAQNVEPFKFCLASIFCRRMLCIAHAP